MNYNPTQMLFLLFGAWFGLFLAKYVSVKYDTEIYNVAHGYTTNRIITSGELNRHYDNLLSILNKGNELNDN